MSGADLLFITYEIGFILSYLLFSVTTEKIIYSTLLALIWPLLILNILTGAIIRIINIISMKIYKQELVPKDE
ncbi:hypothetical protein [Fervidobacterium sp. 2310opik-2]|uniref:hypothetical protein n=1 Tax=Fervidobacterium sp. 2310opik-2 TaxID=1755815 RepID=UPI0013DE8379|nr:hypothetical protein [Fervidobacterium sp. 2310opik-2]KAF2961311.1 hypothetical protein AS161_01840 [Fervidobacterium sp. 2310opik-2]